MTSIHEQVDPNASLYRSFKRTKDEELKAAFLFLLATNSELAVRLRARKHTTVYNC